MVLASLSSALVNLPIVARVACQPRLTRAAAGALALIDLAGAVGVAGQALATSLLRGRFLAAVVL